MPYRKGDLARKLAASKDASDFAASRERLILNALYERPGLNHRQAELLFRKFRRECVNTDVVTGWAGIVQ